MTRASDGVTMIWLFSQILFDIIVLDWRNLIVEFLHLLWDYIYCCYMMVLRQQGCYAQTDVAVTGYCYCYILKIIHHYSVISKINPSFFTIKEGSTSHLGLLSSGEKKETALLGARNRYALRLADHQRSTPYCAGWDRLGINNDGKATSQLQRRHCSIPSLQKSWVVSLL